METKLKYVVNNVLLNPNTALVIGTIAIVLRLLNPVLDCPVISFDEWSDGCKPNYSFTLLQSLALIILTGVSFYLLRQRASKKV